MKFASALVLSVLSLAGSAVAHRGLYAREAAPAYLETLSARDLSALYERSAEADFDEFEEGLYARAASPGPVLSKLAGPKCKVEKLSGGMTHKHTGEALVKKCKGECKCTSKGKLDCGASQHACSQVCDC